MAAYYNEIDKFAAAWLRELIKAGQIADGEVDEQSIEDIVPSDLRNFTQCHFFAGVGVWSYALRRAGWPDDRPVWTGSCPCQPFSTAGKRKGTADERHLWPALFHLIQQAKPSGVPVFGEQVASKDGLAWLDLVQADVEAARHALWAFDFCAAGFGAPHIRQRLYFVAHPTGAGRAWRVRGDGSEEARIGRLCVPSGESPTSNLAISASDRCDQGQPESEEQQRIANAVRPGSTGYVANTTSERRQSGRGWISQQGQPSEDVASHGETGKLADAGCSENNQQGNAGSTEPGRNGTNHGVPCGSSGELWPTTGALDNAGSPRPQRYGLQPLLGERQRAEQSGEQPQHGSTGSGATDELGDTEQSRLEGLSGAKRDGGEPGRIGEITGGSATEASPTNGFWRDADWLWCRDEKFRPVESITQQMADGTTAPLGRVCDQDIADLEAAIQKEVNAHSTEADAGKALSDVWHSLVSETLQVWTPRRFQGVHEAPILLSFLRQLAAQGWAFSESISRANQETSERFVRSLRPDEEATGASCGRKLEEQRASQSSDLVYLLSSLLARFAQKTWGEMFEQNAKATFPLAQGSPNRVGRLRGYGNALVAPQAEEFIRAYLEVTGGLKNETGNSNNN